DDLVPRVDPERAEDQLERVRAVPDPDAVGGPDVIDELALERGDLGATDEPPVVEHLGPGGVELGADAAVLAAEVEERDGLGKAVIGSRAGHDAVPSERIRATG